MATQPTIELHLLDRSRAQRIAWLLDELALPYSIVAYKRTAAGLAPPELTAVHPLGKSPVITVSNVAGRSEEEPLVLAESGFMAQYLCEWQGKLVPQKWKEGMEGVLGGETVAWARWMHLMHYVEGSFMPVVVISLLIGRECTLLRGGDLKLEC